MLGVPAEKPMRKLLKAVHGTQISGFSLLVAPESHTMLILVRSNLRGGPKPRQGPAILMAYPCATRPLSVNTSSDSKTIPLLLCSRCAGPSHTRAPEPAGQARGSQQTTCSLLSPGERPPSTLQWRDQVRAKWSVGRSCIELRGRQQLGTRRLCRS
jgi:hypothetical protein